MLKITMVFQPDNEDQSDIIDHIRYYSRQDHLLGDANFIGIRVPSTMIQKIWKLHQKLEEH